MSYHRSMGLGLILALLLVEKATAVDNQEIMISAAIQNAELALERLSSDNNNNALADLSSLSETLAKTGDTVKRVAELKSQQDQLIDAINERQLKQFIEKLQNISATEQARRESDANDDDSSTVMEQLHAMLNPEIVLQESETILTEWILNVLQDEVAEQTKGAPDCVTTMQAVTEVHAALNRFQLDGVGRTDHAIHGTIVHELTSATYHQPSSNAATAGNAWWRRYIPQDWEALLPAGWQNWNVEDWIPDHVYHTLGLPGFAKMAPPETILQRSVLPGFCWPVGVSSGAAFVTIRLPYPVFVDAVTIDHASHLLLPHRKEQQKSAPKHVHVYGYAPCEDEKCNGLGFDVSSKRLLMEITYLIEGESNVQTFPVYNGDDGGEEKTTADEGSCSATTFTCGSDATAVAAVRVEIVENWGNRDYTCLYRFRVHGERQ